MLSDKFCGTKENKILVQSIVQRAISLGHNLEFIDLLRDSTDYLVFPNYPLTLLQSDMDKLQGRNND